MVHGCKIRIPGLFTFSIWRTSHNNRPLIATTHYTRSFKTAISSSKMSVYHRYTSREHDEAFFGPRKTDDGVSPVENGPVLTGYIQLLSLGGLFGPEALLGEDWHRATTEWLSLFPNAAYFTGYDEVLFGNVVVIVYENRRSGKICTLSFTAFGITAYEDLILDARSRFWPSCENLLPAYQKSNVRRALAITNLKNYNKIANNPGHFHINKHWDETNAGTLANRMELLTERKPDQLGIKLLEMGLLQPHAIQSVILDVVYDNSSASNAAMVESNNKMVYLLGHQLDQLFDPLLEYSPEAMDITYTPPSTHRHVKPLIQHSNLVNSIVAELLTIQTNFTMGFVNLLQNFIIPLRIYVLSAAPGAGITKINKVFPPTIDEITRINCILHDSLEKAAKYGYVEVIKVLGIILPYFYKAFIRHEANLKGFTARLSRFNKKNHKQVFANSEINKSNFTLLEIESIVAGSLLELPRLKLIIKRLYDSIQSESNKLTNFEAGDNDESAIIETYYKSAIDVIDAFGQVQTNHENRIGSQHRVFTPTGKILTELASNWPPELQYGWLSRKVVGIFELRNVKPFDKISHDSDILIIFSDHLLFLNIADDLYYERKETGPFKTLSLSDILMHSLVNEKPLPSFSLFPRMKVKFWSGMNDVFVSTYRSISSKTSSEEDFLRFVNVSSNGFGINESDERSYTEYFEVTRKHKSDYDGNKIIELINKAKVLHKTQPFHLFKSADPSLHIYSTAHEKEAYTEEQGKSPFALFMNSSQIDFPALLDQNLELYLILNVSFVNESQVRLTGMNRSGSFNVDAIIASGKLAGYLKEIIATNYKLLFSTDASTTRVLTKGYQIDLAYYVHVFNNPDATSSEGNKLSEAPAAAPESAPNADVYSVLESNKMRIGPPNSVIENNYEHSVHHYEHTKTRLAERPLKRRKSLIKLLLDAFKKSPNKHNELETPKGNVEKQRKVTDTEIPRGEQQEFSRLYVPAPELRRASLSGRRVDQVSPAQPPVPEYVPDSAVFDETVSSLYSQRSIVAQDDYAFPVGQSPEIDHGRLQKKAIESFQQQPVPVTEREKRKSITEDNMMILDQIRDTAREQSNADKSALYATYTEEQFYKDGGSNWTTFSRENSSLLEPEIQQAMADIRQLNEISQDSKASPGPFESEVIEELSNIGSDAFLTPNSEPSAHFGERKSLTFTHDSIVPFGYRTKDESIQSLTSSQYIDEFGRQIDVNFSSLARLDEKLFNVLIDETVSLFSHQNGSGSSSGKDDNLTFEQTNDDRKKPNLVISITSSEEEFFSTDEYTSPQLAHIVNAANYSESPLTLNSYSSDGTIINDYARDDKGKVQEKNKALPMLPVGAATEKAPFSNRFDSVAYLSDIISGTADVSESEVFI